MDRSLMILATFLLIISTAVPPGKAPSFIEMLGQSANSPQQPQTQGSASQNPSNPPASATASPPSPPKGKSAAGKTIHPKKKAAESDCSTTTSASTAKTSSTPSAQSNCPPKKIVVRDGGSSEPSVQLVGGGGGDQATRSTNQLLESAEENLKKVDGRDLNSTQQDSVAQIQQYVQQSKSAAAAGDSDRAHTLAWKAQLLSQELIKPQP